MRETSKSALRRWRDGAFLARYFVGQGIDIGAGDDPLSQFVGVFPLLRAARAWDREDGDAQDMAGLPDASFDFVHSSNCLEHLVDPRAALRNWLRILKPGGFLIVTVPDEDLYESGHWPSVRNADHKWSFTIHRPAARHPRSINVVDLVREFGHDIECESMRQIRDFHREDAAGHDQTLGPAECAIEWVWRRRVRQGGRLVAQAWQAEVAGQADLAEATYRAALQDSPDEFDAYNRLAHLYNRLGRPNEAAATWEACVAAMPRSHAARIFQALHLLAMGRHDEGFRLRDPLVPDARRTPVAPPADYPRWQGEDLQGRSIVIWTEFGLGDEIMFARFAHVFKARGAARVSLVCQAPLASVMRTCRDLDAVVAREHVSDLPAHDYWVFGHSIPVHHSIDHHGVPAPVPYLSAPAGPRPRPRAPARGGPTRVGLVWRGNPTHENDHHRSLQGLHVLESLFDVENVEFVCLQPGAEAGAEAARYALWPSLRLTDAGTGLRDFADTAAVIDGLDLVISVDTSTAHLAGAMGKPTWLLLPSLCDWRWGLGQDRTAWYPDMRLYRQRQLGQWAEVIQRVRGDLRREAAGTDRAR